MALQLTTLLLLRLYYCHDAIVATLLLQRATALLLQRSCYRTAAVDAALLLQRWY
jgi:hypothetical protein